MLPCPASRVPRPAGLQWTGSSDGWYDTMVFALSAKTI
jgi:hypothetical protein